MDVPPGVNFSGIEYQRIAYGLYETTQQIDYDRLRGDSQAGTAKAGWVGGTAIAIGMPIAGHPPQWRTRPERPKAVETPPNEKKGAILQYPSESACPASSTMLSTRKRPAVGEPGHGQNPPISAAFGNCRHQGRCPRADIGQSGRAILACSKHH